MKTSNLSRITLLCGLALGIMVLWAGASPIAEGADSLIGGWIPYTGCVCCYSTRNANCNGYAPFGCSSSPLVILTGSGPYGGYPGAGSACRTAGDPSPCFNMFHSCCNCCTP